MKEIEDFQLFKEDFSKFGMIVTYINKDKTIFRHNITSASGNEKQCMKLS
jgi:hypothetical protein